MVVLRLIPVDAMGRHLVEAGSIFFNPNLEAERTVTHCPHGDEPSRFKSVGGTSERIAADEDFCLGAVYISHNSEDG